MKHNNYLTDEYWQYYFNFRSLKIEHFANNLLFHSSQLENNFSKQFYIELDFALFSQTINFIPSIKLIVNMLEDCNAPNSKKFSPMPFNFETIETINTKEFLKTILVILLNHNNENHFQFIETFLRIFLKKFEISKELCLSYDKNLKPINKNKDLVGVVYLSLCLLQLYIKTKNMKYLNTALKINDSLIAAEMMLNDKTKFLLLPSLIIEVHEIYQLYNNS